MPSDAYRRARQSASARSGALWLGSILAAIQALFLVGLLVVGGLLTALCESGGVTRLSAETVAHVESTKVPSWLYNRLPHDAPGPQDVLDTGLYPMASANLDSPFPPHRIAAQSLARLVRQLPFLRSNFGALRILLALGLGLALAAAYFGQWRRSLAASAAGAAATSLSQTQNHIPETQENQT